MPTGTPLPAPETGQLFAPETQQSGPALAAFGITEPDLWHHETVTPAELAAGVVNLTPPGDFSRVLIAVVDAVSVFGVLNGTPGQVPNSYDLVNPGGSLLNFPVRRSQNLLLLAASGLSFNVDVWLFGGSFSYRAQ